RLRLPERGKVPALTAGSGAERAHKKSSERLLRKVRIARPHPDPLPRGEGVGADVGRGSMRRWQPPTFRSARAGTSAAYAAQRRPKPAHDPPSPGGEGRGEGERPSNSFPRFPA